jgi:hypothetical protein
MVRVADEAQGCLVSDFTEETLTHSEHDWEDHRLAFTATIAKVPLCFGPRTSISRMPGISEGVPGETHLGRSSKSIGLSRTRR